MLQPFFLDYMGEQGMPSQERTTIVISKNRNQHEVVQAKKVTWLSIEHASSFVVGVVGLLELLGC